MQLRLEDTHRPNSTDATRKRTADTWTEMVRILPPIPPSVLDFLTALVQRIEDLEDRAGYTRLDEVVVSNSINTQGR